MNLDFLLGTLDEESGERTGGTLKAQLDYQLNLFSEQQTLSETLASANADRSRRLADARVTVAQARGTFEVGVANLDPTNPDVDEPVAVFGSPYEDGPGSQADLESRRAAENPNGGQTATGYSGADGDDGNTVHDPPFVGPQAPNTAEEISSPALYIPPEYNPRLHAELIAGHENMELDLSYVSAFGDVPSKVRDPFSDPAFGMARSASFGPDALLRFNETRRAESYYGARAEIRSRYDRVVSLIEAQEAAEFRSALNRELLADGEYMAAKAGLDAVEAEIKEGLQQIQELRHVSEEDFRKNFDAEIKLNLQAAVSRDSDGNWLLWRHARPESVGPTYTWDWQRTPKTIPGYWSLEPRFLASTLSRTSVWQIPEFDAAQRLDDSYLFATETALHFVPGGTLADWSLSPQSRISGGQVLLATAGDLTFFLSWHARGLAAGNRLRQAEKFQRGSHYLSLGTNASGGAYNLYSAYSAGGFSGATLGDTVLRLALIGLELKGHKASMKGLKEIKIRPSGAGSGLLGKIGSQSLNATAKETKELIVQLQQKVVKRYNAAVQRVKARLSGARGGNRLVIGGGRADGFPILRDGDVALNISSASKADIIGDIRNVDPSKLGTFKEVFFERFPFDVIDDVAASNAAKMLESGGKLHILTGRAASRNAIRESLEKAGFVDIHISENLDRVLEITARLGGG